MTAANATVKRVLFVDDDAPFLETIRELMAAYSEGCWEVLTASSASQAFSLLQEQVVDLAVLDVQMPVMDGIQMLSLLNRSHPSLQKVALSGFANEKYRAACLSHGAELFLEKPRSREEWQSLHATLNELLKLGPATGFRGVMRRVELSELIQMECVTRNSSRLQINAEGLAGEIFIRAGALIHAVAAGCKGREALHRLLALRSGDFKLAPFVEPPEQTLDGPWEAFLLNASDQAEASAQTSQPEARHPEILPKPQASGFKVQVSAAAAPDERATERPVVEEVLLCSAQGEVLHEWQCNHLDLWLKFLEFVSQKSQRISQAVALGDFDRLEIVRPDSRIVVLICADRGVMIRSRRPRPGARTAATLLPGAVRLALNEAAKEQLTQWLRRSPSARGVLVRSIRFSDQTLACDLDSRDFPATALEQAARSVADTFQVLHAHRQLPLRLTWEFSRATLHCARRMDGALLTAVALSKPGATDTAGLDRLLSEFHELTLTAN